MIPLLIAAVVLAVFVVSLGLRRHGEHAHPQVGWQPTTERFRDPSTGRTMRVWIDASGDRHYIPEDG